MRSDRYILRGFEAYHSGKFGEAVDAFEIHLQHFPNDWRTIFWLARAHFECKNTAKALCLLKDAEESRGNTPVAAAFASMILYDSADYEGAISRWMGRRSTMTCALGEGIILMAHIRMGKAPTRRMLELCAGGNAELRGRALHLAEERLRGYPESVRRDFMDEVGIGWPGYRIPPVALQHGFGNEGRIWRLMAQGRCKKAYDQAESWLRGDLDGKPHAQTLIAAAIMADRWDSVLEWALSIDDYAAYAHGESPPAGHRTYQFSLFEGWCLMECGELERARHCLMRAADNDRSAYLPLYALGKIGMAQNLGSETRNSFIAMCRRVNPSLPRIRWIALLDNGSSEKEPGSSSDGNAGDEQ